MSQWLELEEQKYLSKMRTLAFASAAHEFRNPLNAISSSLELMELKSESLKKSQYFTIAKNCSNLLLFLVKDIMDLSQIESNSLVLNISNTNILELLKDCVTVLKFKADEKKIVLKVHNPMIQPMIKTDENRVKQIIINLVSNAIKYTEEGSVQIAFSEDSDFIRIAVRDTGTGISPE